MSSRCAAEDRGGDEETRGETLSEGTLSALMEWLAGAPGGHTRGRRLKRSTSGITSGRVLKGEPGGGGGAYHSQGQRSGTTQSDKGFSIQERPGSEVLRF